MLPVSRCVGGGAGVCYISSHLSHGGPGHCSSVRAGKGGGGGGGEEKEGEGEGEGWGGRGGEGGGGGGRGGEGGGGGGGRGWSWGLVSLLWMCSALVFSPFLPSCLPSHAPSVFPFSSACLPSCSPPRVKGIPAAFLGSAQTESVAIMDRLMR